MAPEPNTVGQGANLKEIADRSKFGREGGT
jgi:hypothetical protein